MNFPRPIIKICGTTSIFDAEVASESGADFFGVILNHPASPRHVSLALAREIRTAVPIPVVALTVNQNLATLFEICEVLHPHALQLHGDEPPALIEKLVAHGFEVWKAISGDETALLQGARQFSEAGASAILVDAREISPGATIYGGTGKLADWNGARSLVESGFQVILAGGLSPENVSRAVQTVQPWAVDVVSGVESRKGVKDAQKVREFVANVRSATPD